MAATVDILIKATDQASAVLKGTTGNLQGFGKGLNEVVQGLTGLNLAQVSVVGGIIAVGNTAKKAVTDFMDYALAMDKLSLVMGTSVEETSRLVQVADDFRVEQRSVEMAMRMAAQNGYTPSIALMAQMADKFNALTDPAARAAAMQEVFGRSWAELLPLLEQGGEAIRQAAAEMDAGMVVTRRQADEAIRAAKALDDWNDSWTAVKNNFASNVIPTMTDWLDKVNLFNEARAQGMGQKETQEYVRIMTEGQKATEDWNSAEREAMKTGQQSVSITRQESNANTQVTGTLYAQSAALRTQREAQNRTNQTAEAAKKNYDEITARAKALNEATRQLNQAQQDFNENFGNKASQSLSKYAGEGKKYREGLAIQDEVLGTNTAAQYDAQKAMDELSKKFASGQITADDYKAGLKEQQPVWEQFNEKLMEAKRGFTDAQTAFNNFLSSLAAADGRTFTVNVTTEYGGGGGGIGGGGGGSGSGTGGTGGGKGKWMAAGGSAFAGKPYYVGELGPEPFVPATNGYILSRSDAQAAFAASQGAGGGGAGIVMNINANLPGVTNPRQFVVELGRMARAAQMRGAGFAGGMA